VFIKSSLTLTRTKHDLKLTILNALGIDINNPSQKVDWESFLLLNKLIHYNKASNDEFIDFFLKFFDQNNDGIVTDKEFKGLIELLFGSGEKDESIEEENSNRESVTENLMHICKKNGVF